MRCSVEECQRLQKFYMKYGTLPVEYPMPPKNVALILHPDPLARSQFGCLHVSEMYFYLHLATAYIEGWNDCHAENAGKSWQRYAGYADVREMLRGFCDLPELWAEQVAMYMTRDMRDMPYMEFNPLL